MQEDVDFEKSLGKTNNRTRADLMRTQLSETGAKSKLSEISESLHIDVREFVLSELVDNPYQPRLSYSEDSIFELAMSIKKEGLLQPIEVVMHEDGRKIVNFGHRRVRAYRKLKLSKIVGFVAKNGSDKTLRTHSLIENIQRDEMCTIDMALSFEAALRAGDFDNQSKLAEAIGKDKSFVSKTLKLLAMPKVVLDDLLKNKTINDRVVLDLIRRVSPESDCIDVYNWYIENKCTREELKNKIASLGEIGEEPVFTIKETPKGYVLKLPKLNQKKLKKVEEFIKKLFE